MEKVERREIRVVQIRCKYCHPYLKDTPESAVLPGIAKGQMSRVKDTLSIYSKAFIKTFLCARNCANPWRYNDNIYSQESGMRQVQN